MGPIIGGVPRLKYDPAKVAVTFDGNSHVYFMGQYSLMPSVSTVPITYVGLGGQTWRMMNGLDGGSTADVDGAYVPGKTNVLIAWEGTNTLRAGTVNGGLAWQQCKDYCAARQAYVAANRPGEKPWVILLGTCLPLGTGQNGAVNNVQVNAYNALMLAEYRSAGIKGVFDIRSPESPFYLDSSIDSAPYSNGDSLHLTNPGYSLIGANYILPALSRLVAR